MCKIKNKISIYLILIFSILAIISAYFIQYILGHKPCNLCLIERIPFLIIIVIISLFLFYKKYEKILLFSLSVVFFILSLISIYHFGIEQGFIKESLVCDLNANIENLTKEELLNKLKEKPISCKDVTFKIMGLSLATINIFISAILSIITLKLFFDYEKNK